MDLGTFQHILIDLGLQSVALRSQQRHADKWISLLLTDDKEAEFKEMVVLAIQTNTMRTVFSCGDVMIEAMLEAANLDRLKKDSMKTVGTSQAEAVAHTKPKARPKTDFNLGEANTKIDGGFWTQNLDKMFWLGQDEYMADALDEPCDTDNCTDFKCLSLSFQEMQDFKCPDGMCQNVQ